MEESFDAFWEFRASVPLEKLVDLGAAAEGQAPKGWHRKEDFAFHGLFGDIGEDASDRGRVRALFVKTLIPVEEASFISDDPGKNDEEWLGLYSGKGKTTLELARLVAAAERSIYIDTPYLVLSKPAIALFSDLKKRRPGIDIRIATNSLAATDSWFTYAASFQQKQIYLRNLGFRIYEMKPLPGDMRTFMRSYDRLRTRPLTPSEEKDIFRPPADGEFLTVSPGAPEQQVLEEPPQPGEPYFCLHAKSFVIDDEIVFIGSYNLDPRSENINTEVGLVVRDRGFAAAVKESIKRDMEPQNAWVIARNRYPLKLGGTNAILEELSRLFPIVDPWPVRYAGSYELMDDAEPVDPDHPDFYEHYRNVGNFPHVAEDRGDKILGAWTVKTFFGTAKPLL
jgi:phosphatidylserine/phosphatidylglycerophosphate/cardiolipin synthase-like enzyme